MARKDQIGISLEQESDEAAGKETVTSHLLPFVPTLHRDEDIAEGTQEGAVRVFLGHLRHPKLALIEC